MSRLRLAMMGTGEFALPSFGALYDTRHEVAGLITQPDRGGPGRHRGHVNPLKRLAEERGVPVLQPADVNAAPSLDELARLSVDVLVVAAYGQILSPALLALPRVATINVHASVLPRYRGAAPVAYAILKGESETGVSIIQVLPRLDAGPILATAATPIGPAETAGALEDRLALLAVPLLAPVLEQLAAGTTEPRPQDETLATRAPKLKKDLGLIDWSQSATQIDRHVRAMQPWPNPCTWLHAEGKPSQRLLILGIRAGEAATDASQPPGAVLRADGAGWWVQTGSGPAEILRVQPEGKRPMSAADFLRGNPLPSGSRFRSERLD